MPVEKIHCQAVHRSNGIEFRFWRHAPRVQQVLGGLICLCLFAAPALSKVPSAKEILRKTHAWGTQLPPQTVTYRIVVTHPQRTKAGTAVLNAGRVLLSQLPELSNSAATVLWGALLRSEGVLALRKAGIDTRQTSLFHRNRRIVVVVGSKAGKLKNS